MSHFSTNSDLASEQSSSVSLIDEHSMPRTSPLIIIVGLEAVAVSGRNVGEDTSAETS